MQHLMDHDIIHHGKREAPGKASAKKYFCICVFVQKQKCCFSFQSDTHQLKDLLKLNVDFS